jgi:enoyl-CoA hydratase / 3-hydroxyacyl-CoA dehydrogenase
MTTKRRERLSDNAVIYQVTNNTAWLTMNRPEVLNALSKDMFKELKDAVVKATKDRAVYFVGIQGAGRAFSAGLDIREVSALTSAKQARDFVFQKVKPFWKEYFQCDKPILSLVDGPAFGAGAEIALASDIVVCSARSTFAFSGGRVGALCCISAAFGQLTMNGRKVVEMNLTGAAVDGEQAKSLGLVNYVEDPAQLDERVNKILSDMRQVSPISNSSFKRIRRGNITERLIQLSHKELLRSIMSPEFKKGAIAFTKKEHPDYYQ